MSHKEERTAIVVATHETDDLLQRLFLTYKGSNTFLIVTIKNVLTDVVDGIDPMERLVELSREDAVRWIKKYTPNAMMEFERLLQRNEEEMPKGPLPIRIGGLLREKVDSMCDEFKLTANGVISGIVGRYIEDYRQFLRDSGTPSTHRSFLASEKKKK